MWCKNTPGSNEKEISTQQKVHSIKDHSRSCQEEPGGIGIQVYSHTLNAFLGFSTI